MSNKLHAMQFGSNLPITFAEVTKESIGSSLVTELKLYATS